MFKWSIFISVLLIVIVPSIGLSRDMSGRFGLGYYRSEAPIGFRYWLTSRIGLDIGIGIESVDEGSKRATSFWFEVGSPYVLYESKLTNFFLRPGILFKSLDDRVHGTGRLEENWTEIEIQGYPGVELFYGEHFSAEVSHGLSFKILKLPEELTTDTFINYNTISNGITQIGFHYYFD
jgi:hypothetical protein